MLGRSPGEGNDNPLQYPCLENLMDRGAWWAAVHGVTKSQAWLSDFHFHFTFRLLPSVHAHRLAKMDYQQRGLWVGWHHVLYGDTPSLLTSKEPFCACVVSFSLTSRMRNKWSLLSYLARAQPPPSSCFYGVSATVKGNASSHIHGARNITAICDSGPPNVNFWIQKVLPTGGT